MRSIVVLVGPKIFPPFDSAYSSIGFNLLKTILREASLYKEYLVAVVSSYDLHIYASLYGQKPPELLSCVSFKSLVKKIYVNSFIKHTWSVKDSLRLDYLLLSLLKQFSEKGMHAIVQTLIPLRLTMLYDKVFRRSVEVRFSHYLFYVPAFSEQMLLSKAYDLVLISSKTLQTPMMHASSKCLVIPPPIDTEFFKPLPAKYTVHTLNEPVWYGELLEYKDRGKTLLLYIGPVHPDRFPPNIVLPMLKALKHRGVDPLLVIVTTIRYVGKDDKYVNLWRNLATKMSNNVKIYVRALSEEEKLILYNLANVVLYPVAGPWHMAIPPLTPLEAYACGKPVIITSSIPGYQELIVEGLEDLLVSKLSLDEFLNALNKALNLSSKELNKLREFCCKKHSLEVVGKKLTLAYESLLH